MKLGEFVQLNEVKALAPKAPTGFSGTKVSGLVRTKDGTHCRTCLHYADDSCNHPVVMADPKVEKNDHGDAIVDDNWCCGYWWPKEGVEI